MSTSSTVVGAAVSSAAKAKATTAAMIAVVAASSKSRGIGINGGLPWRIPGDMAHFKSVTSEPPSPGLVNVVVMGRKTWESIPRRFRPLDGRTNVVLTTQRPPSLAELHLPPTPDDKDASSFSSSSSSSVVIASSLTDAAQKLKSMDCVGDVFVVGGERVYREAMERGMVDRVLLTEVLEETLPEVSEGAHVRFDTFFPELNNDVWECRPFRGRNCKPWSVEEEAEDEDGEGGGNGEEEKKEGDSVIPMNGGEDEVREKRGGASVAEVHTDVKSGIQYRFLDFRRRKAMKAVGEREEATAAISSSLSSSGVSPDAVASEQNDEPSSLSANAAATSSTTMTTMTTPADSADTIEEGAHINPEEMQYLDLCRDIIESGTQRGDRTGTGTLSKFGAQMRFSLREGTLPLLTTKRTFWRGVAEELLWFVSGSTDANALSARGVHIWDGNGSREFLDGRGLTHREVGDLGPVYGFQWRHFGAAYTDMHANYDGKGVDQLADCIDKIRHHPEDRRIVMSAWNPADLDAMALPPCHMFCQFYVDTNKNELSCQMYQRSADMGLGVPFNIASYALLTHMVAQVTGRKPGDFVHTIGDAHVYLNHVDALREQLNRPPRAFPKIRINPDKTDIDDFVYDDFEVVGYKPHKTIKMKMAV